MLLKSATTILYPLGAMMALRNASTGRGFFGSMRDKFCGLTSNPDHRWVTQAPAYLRGNGNVPRSEIDRNASVRVIPIVDLNPILAAKRACTIGLGWSSSIVNSSSVLANAHVSLPVVGLILRGGSIPFSFNNLANCSLLISCFCKVSSVLTLSSFIRLSIRLLRSSPISCRATSSNFLSSLSIGSVNIRTVRSISFSSFFGNCGIILVSNVYVSSTSLMQYSPYSFISISVKSSLRLPIAL